jgi:cleavage and polyadenylation specificity factor subunit 1
LSTHVYAGSIANLNPDLNLSQILPMLDEETGAEPRVISANIVDPYLLLIRDDSSAYLASIDKNNELEEVEKEDAFLVSTKWLSGCLYRDHSGIFGGQAERGSKKEEDILMFLLSAAGALYVSSHILHTLITGRY